MYLFPYTPPLYAPTVHYLSYFTPFCYTSLTYAHTFIFLPIWRLYPLRYVNIPSLIFPQAASVLSSTTVLISILNITSFNFLFWLYLPWCELKLISRLVRNRKFYPLLTVEKIIFHKVYNKKGSGFEPIFVPVSRHTSTTPCLVIFFHRWEIN